MLTRLSVDFARIEKVRRDESELVRLFDFDPCRLVRQVKQFDGLRNASARKPPHTIFAAEGGEDSMGKQVEYRIEQAR